MSPTPRFAVGAVRNRRADRVVRPYGSATKGAMGGRPQGSPLRKRYKGCGAKRNPPVTAAPCQPPLGKGDEGTGGTDCHGQCAHWLRNDRGFCKGCGTGMKKQVSRFTHLFLSCSFLRQFRIIGQERFVSKFCDLIRRGFEAILDVLQEIATKSECKISAKRRSFNCAVLP